MGGSTPVPTRTALRRQTPNLTSDGKRQLSAFQNLKTQCAYVCGEIPIGVVRTFGIFAFQLVLPFSLFEL
jgi:hypothetical protein